MSWLKRLVGGAERPQGGDAVAAFWAWFAKADRKIRAGSETIQQAMSTELCRIDPGLVWEITPKQNEHDWEFSVSADGVEALFSTVESVVLAAPTLPGWRVHAFRQRGPLDVRIRLPGGSLSLDDIWFSATPGTKVQLKIYVPAAPGLAEHTVGAAGVLLDNALGEYDSVMSVDVLGFEPLPENPASHGLSSLRKLPALVDSRKVLS
jgi:hypothetical protein